MTKEKSTKGKTTVSKKVKPIFACVRDVYLSMCRQDVVILPRITVSLRRVMEWGDLTKEQACLFSYFASLGINGEVYYDIGEMQNYIDLEYSDYLEYIPDFDILLQRGFFALRYDFQYTPGSFSKTTQFYLPEPIEEALSYNRPFKPYFPEGDSQYDVLAFLFRCRQEEFIKKTNYYENLIESFYKDDPFLKQFNANGGFTDKHFSKYQALQFFIYVSIHLLDGDTKSFSVKDALTTLDPNNPNWIMRGLKTFKDESSWFIKQGIFKLEKADLGDDIMITWGTKAKEEIFQGDAELFLSNSLSSKELGKFESAKIKVKDLFYNDNNIKDIERLEGLLDDDRYNEMRKRLDERGMPKGLIVLLYGAPGTGKTETVMQLARKTKRDVLHVNIQEVRSCWVGETEKNMKKIFDVYRENKSERKPILLFNEADAILSKRTTAVTGQNSAVNKMENSMQNIILEELENFDGILFLTSNLAQTLDDAFDRRILFKLKFENPTRDVKKKIWKNKIDFLSESDLDRVVDFEFSGGQIENVRRKITIDEVLYGNVPNIDNIVDFCKKEKLEREASSRIGFHND